MFKTLNNDPNAMQKGRRTVFIVSDATAITADTLAHSVLTQFSDFEYDQYRLPFVDTVEKAQAVAKRINLCNATARSMMPFPEFLCIL